MAHLVVVFIAMFALAACGGGQPAASTAAQDPKSAGGDDGTAGSAVADNPGNEFQLTDSDASKRARGVRPSQIEATRTEAAIRFTVVDKDKGPVRGVVISLTEPGGATYYTEETDAEGFAELLVPVGKKYDLVYLSLGRRDVSAKVEVGPEPKQNLNLTLRYKRYDPPTPPGRKPSAAPRFVLKDIQFDTGKSVLRAESFPRLDSIVEFMAHKKSARVEISGHTDNVGNPKRNKELSEKRAQACREYLIGKGIDGERIEAVGYGDEQPIAGNDTEEGRQQNRRIEATEL